MMAYLRSTTRARSRAATSSASASSPAPATRRRAAVAERHLADFEQRYCYDRFWADAGAAPNTRYLCSGHALVVVGERAREFFGCRDRGVLAQFRHQYFLLFLIAHFHKAALLMFPTGWWMR